MLVQDEICIFRLHQTITLSLESPLLACANISSGSFAAFSASFKDWLMFCKFGD